MNKQEYDKAALELDALSAEISELNDAELDELQNRLDAVAGVMV